MGPEEEKKKLSLDLTGSCEKQLPGIRTLKKWLK